MSLAFKRIKLYTKLVLILIVALAIGMVLIKNRDNTVKIWFFWVVDPQQPINVVWLLLCAAVASVVSWWVLLKALTLVKDMRELHRQEQQREIAKAQEDRAKELQEQERRIDQKISKVIGSEAEPTE